MVIGGEMMETSKATINKALKFSDVYEWKREAFLTIIF